MQRGRPRRVGCVQPQLARAASSTTTRLLGQAAKQASVMPQAELLAIHALTGMRAKGSWMDCTMLSIWFSPSNLLLACAALQGGPGSAQHNE